MRFDFGQRRTRDEGERGVAGVQVREVTHAVNQEGAGVAALVPARVEHEVVDDELVAPLEYVSESRLAAGPLEDILLGYRDHGQPTAFGAQRVPRPAGFLLPGEQLLTRDEPLLSRCDLWEIHGDLLCDSNARTWSWTANGPPPIRRLERRKKDRSGLLQHSPRT